jgi:magnesium-dependent phosphatase-1
MARILGWVGEVAGRSWLLLLDLDGTMWDHLDVSKLKLPFRRINGWTIVDANGVPVRLRVYMVKLALWARRNKGIVSSLSWNPPLHALAALHAFGIDGIFDYHVIEPHPWKGRALAKLLRTIWRERRIRIPPNRIVYFDDRDIHLDDIRENVGSVNYVRSNVDCRTFEECRELVLRFLGSP